MKQVLQKLLEENQGTITEVVINDALDYAQNPVEFFTDLLQNGCQS